MAQIARDSGLSRQSIYLWCDGTMPRERVFNSLLAMDKYYAALSKIDYKKERAKIPLGRKRL